MTTNRQLGLSKIRSLQQSLFTGITELEVRAATAAQRGDEETSSKLSLQAVVLAKEGVRLRKAEDYIRAEIVQSSDVTKLDTIAGDARTVTETLRASPDALVKTNTLLKLVQRVAIPFCDGFVE